MVWWKRHWVHVLAAFVVGAGIGGAGGSSGADDAEKRAVAAEAKVKTAEERASEAEEAAQAAAEEAEQAQSDAAASIQETRDALAKQKAALDAREKRISGAEAAAKANTFPGDGVYLVGKDIRPGTYRSAGGENCYWARHNKANAILDNHLGAGPTVVVVRSSDFSLEVAHCAEFRRI